MITNLDEIANKFNKYFINIERSLNNNQIQTITSSNDYLLQHNKNEITFHFVSVNEVYIDNIICSRDKATQCGLVVNVYSNQIMIRQSLKIQ